MSGRVRFGFAKRQQGFPKPDRLGIAAAVTVETEFGASVPPPPRPGPPRGFSLLRGSEMMQKSFYFSLVPHRFALFFSPPGKQRWR